MARADFSPCQAASLSSLTCSVKKTSGLARMMSTMYHSIRGLALTRTHSASATARVTASSMLGRSTPISLSTHLLGSFWVLKEEIQYGFRAFLAIVCPAAFRFYTTQVSEETQQAFRGVPSWSAWHHAGSCRSPLRH